MDKSILSFKGQVQGAGGLLINASDFTIEDLAIEDTAGDALKINSNDRFDDAVSECVAMIRDWIAALPGEC